VTARAAEAVYPSGAGVSALPEQPSGRTG
jgi:hypothetical protein